MPTIPFRLAEFPKPLSCVFGVIRDYSTGFSLCRILPSQRTDVWTTVKFNQKVQANQWNEFHRVLKFCTRASLASPIGTPLKTMCVWLQSSQSFSTQKSSNRHSTTEAKCMHLQHPKAQNFQFVLFIKGDSNFNYPFHNLPCKNHLSLAALALCANHSIHTHKSSDVPHQNPYLGSWNETKPVT